MPVKPLPKKLIPRLIRVSHIIERWLGKMKSVDHRTKNFLDHETSTSEWGYRVRQMDVSRNFPGTELVIKKTHTFPANKKIKSVNNMVRIHNELYKPENYVLLAPKAYAIGENLLAMAKTNKPSLEEVLGSKKTPPTERGKNFFQKMKKKHKITEMQLRKAVRQVVDRTNIFENNLLFLGVKNGKFVFMPLLDLGY